MKRWVVKDLIDEHKDPEMGDDKDVRLLYAFAWRRLGEEGQQEELEKWEEFESHDGY